MIQWYNSCLPPEGLCSNQQSMKPQHPLSASQVMLVVKKNLPANAGDARDTGLIPELGKSPER